MDIFCERLKELRIEKNMTLVHLANILSVSHTTILRWEKGIIIPGIDHLRNIAKYFNVSSDYLLGLED